MLYEIKVPSPGESITQVQIAKWLADDGSEVEKDQEIVEIDSDKATFPLTSPEDGILKILVSEGETVSVGTIIATVEPVRSGKKAEEKILKKETGTSVSSGHGSFPASRISPLAENILSEGNIKKEEIIGKFKGRRIGRKDAEKIVRQKSGSPVIPSGERTEERKTISALRQKLAERLVSVKNETAMLTTFNEINMGEVLAIKEKCSADFKVKHGVNLGLTSFFAKAVSLALADFPQVHSMIDDNELVTPKYLDLGIAVSAPKGLVVPVIRNAEKMSLPELEIRIRELAEKARENRITIEEMKGGSFTITNGGIFGSMMSTPILNPPQSAILGLHKFMERPVAISGKVEIRPMMYIALSYDHRVIDGRESVGFLIKVKEYIETPLKMVPEGSGSVITLLGL